ncbi:MAG: acyltransferase family protein [Mucilaginibacter sp.]
MQEKELQDRNFGLDLVRCLAILLVLADHSLLAFYNRPPFKAITAYCGILGVDLFFVLSGFLIGTILIKTHHKEVVTTFKSVKSFWIRRWFRTLPNYFFVFAVYLVFFKTYSLYIPYHKLALYVVFLQTCFTHNQWFYGVAWSLSIEEWFYLLFPLGLILFQHLLKNNKQKVEVAVIIGFLITCLLLRIFVSLHLHNDWDEGIRKQMPLRLDSIAVGVFAAWVKFYYKHIWDSYKNASALAGGILFLVLTGVLYYTFLKADAVYGNFFLNTFYFTLMSFALAMFLPFAYALKFTNFKYLKYSITYVSLLSYSIYLIHPIFSYLVPYYFHGKLSPAIMVIMLWVLTFVASHLVYNLFEKRVTVLRDHYSYKKEPVAA